MIAIYFIFSLSYKFLIMMFCLINIAYWIIIFKKRSKTLDKKHVENLNTIFTTWYLNLRPQCWMIESQASRPPCMPQLNNFQIKLKELAIDLRIKLFIYSGSGSKSGQQWTLPPPLPSLIVCPPPQLYCPNFCLPKHYCPRTIRSNQSC